MKKIFSFDNRFLAPVLVTCILLVGQLTFGFLESWWKTAIAIVTAIGIELVLGKLFVGKWPHPASSYISGISVGMLIRTTLLWPYILCSLISVTSKYVLRIKDRHIWNPSNFGIVAMLILDLALNTSYVSTLSIQWGNELSPMLIVWTLGSIIIYRLKRFHICVTYVVSFVFFAWVRSFITGHPFEAEVAPITGPMYQLFVFFMITDPKTTVRNKMGQIVAVFCVALVEMILRLNAFVFPNLRQDIGLMLAIHAPYYALFITGPVANMLEIWWTSRRKEVIWTQS